MTFPDSDYLLFSQSGQTVPFTASEFVWAVDAAWFPRLARGPVPAFE